MQKLITTMTLLGFILPLAACGTSATDRTVSGAGLGAGGGAIAGALIPGLGLGTGALIGAAGGAIAGGATTSNDFNFGRPVWRQ